MRVAALDNDVKQLDLFKDTLEAMGHDCRTFVDGDALLAALRRESFDLLILDWKIHGISCREIVAWVRSNVEEHVPILLNANRRTERDVVEGLGVGADDFVSKPIGVAELAARVTALLRRGRLKPHSHDEIWGRYRFILPLGELEIDGAPVRLTRKEFNLALLLFRKLGHAVSRRYILERMWNANPVGTASTSRSLDTHVSRVRTALGLNGENGYQLAAIYGRGYCLKSILTPETA
jgi:DNA-binding response OmpR family regulator